jgi:transcriptional regulator with XRE-family HTH domain
VAGSGPFADDERCQDFVADMKTQREALGWTQQQLADECNVSVSLIANIESYQRAPLIEHGEAIDKAFRLRQRMFTRAARAIQGQSFPEAFARFPDEEATADDLYIWEHSLVPGLVQIEPYTRAIFETLLNITPEEVNRKVSGRMSRQDVLFRKDKPPRLWALVDESALRRPVASPEVMYDQCMHLLELSKLANVSLAVVPYSAGGHIGLEGACTIVERDGLPRIVNLADLGDGRVTEDPVIVRRVALRFRSLQHEAMSNGASRDAITRMAETWKESARTGARALAAVPPADSA